MGKSLVVIGLLMAGIGLLMMLGLPLGRLPGDIVYRRGNVTFVFPLATCLLISVILTLIFTFLRR